MASKNTSAENSVIARTVIMASMLLGGLFIAVMFFQNGFSKIFGKYADEAVIGLMLLALWLVVSSSVRTINRLAGRAAAWKLVLGGVLITLISTILMSAFMIVFPNVAKSENMQDVAGATGTIILLNLALAVVISLIAVINLRVANKMLGNLLEILIIGACLLAFVYFATR
jgi:hypothetical protein